MNMAGEQTYRCEQVSFSRISGNELYNGEFPESTTYLTALHKVPQMSPKVKQSRSLKLKKGINIQESKLLKPT